MSVTLPLPIRPHDDCRATVVVPKTTRPAPTRHTCREQEVHEQHTAPTPSWRLAWNYVCQSALTGGSLGLIDVAVTTVLFVIVASIADWTGWAVTGTLMARQWPVWLLVQTAVMAAHQAYPGAGLSAVAELRACIRSVVFTASAMIAVNTLWATLHVGEACLLTTIGLLGIVALPAGRMLSRGVLSRTSWWGVRVLLIGSRRHTSEVCRLYADRRRIGYIPVGYVCHFSDYVQHADRDPHLLGPGYDARSLAIEHRAPVAVIASSEATHLADRLLLQFPSLLWLSRTADRHVADDPVGSFESHRRGSLLQWRSRILKRTFDVVAVSIGLTLLSPLLIGIAAIIKLRCPGPVFYASSRIGGHGRRIRMWKFRTMVTNSDEMLQAHLAANPEADQEWQATQKLRDDPRIIPGIGHFLRRSSLDEIPQLFNVLVGQMSLVGPRPLPPAEVVKYDDQYFHYSHMWPGITGLWQVSGRNNTDFHTRVFLVNRYASNWSLWLDAWILVKTPIVVLTGRGAC